MRFVMILLLLMAAYGCAVAPDAESVSASPSSAESQSHAAGLALWRKGQRVELKAEAQNFVFEFGANNETRLKLAAGELLLIGGQALLSRGTALPPGKELSVVDDAFLKYQLALHLLTESQPQGPLTLVTPQRVAIDEPSRAISVGTQNVAGYYPAPWSLRGSLQRSADQSIAFDLMFEYSGSASSARNERLMLSGIWKNTPTPAALPDTMPLTDWTFYRIRMGTQEVQGMAQAAYVAVPEPLRFRTLGELRAALGAKL